MFAVEHRALARCTLDARPGEWRFWYEPPTTNRLTERDDRASLIGYRASGNTSEPVFELVFSSTSGKTMVVLRHPTRPFRDPYQYEAIWPAVEKCGGKG
jgi:hypothetical protein